MRYILYGVEVDGETWKNRIAFRDYLQENAHITNAYIDYKQQLSKQFASNLKAYQKAKGEFVRKTLQKLW